MGWPVLTAMRTLEPSALVSKRTRVGTTLPSTVTAGDTLDQWIGNSLRTWPPSGLAGVFLRFLTWMFTPSTSTASFFVMTARTLPWVPLWAPAVTITWSSLRICLAIVGYGLRGGNQEIKTGTIA